MSKVKKDAYAHRRLNSIPDPLVVDSDSDFAEQPARRPKARQGKVDKAREAAAVDKSRKHTRTRKNGAKSRRDLEDLAFMLSEDEDSESEEDAPRRGVKGRKMATNSRVKGWRKSRPKPADNPLLAYFADKPHLLSVEVDADDESADADEEEEDEDEEEEEDEGLSGSEREEPEEPIVLKSMIGFEKKPPPPAKASTPPAPAAVESETESSSHDENIKPAVSKPTPQEQEESVTESSSDDSRPVTRITADDPRAAYRSWTPITTTEESSSDEDVKPAAGVKRAAPQEMRHDTDKRRKVAQSPRKTGRPPQNPTEESETEDDTDGECYAINPKLEPRPDIPDAPKPIGPHVLDKVKKIYIPNPVNRFLRPYQRDGVQFMYKCYKEGHGGCLGDDMGLGKTIQVISFLSAIMGKTGTARDRYRRRDYVSELQDRPDWRTNMPRADAKWPTALIVVPTSTVASWEREVNKWGYFELGVYTSQLNKDERAGMLRDFKLGRLDTMIVSHNMLRTDIDSFGDLAISCVFLDEAHVIKRADAGLTQAVNRFKCMRRFALTGTLIQNSYMEMHPVLDWTNPGALGTRAQWKSTIVKPLVVGQSASATAEQRMKQDEIAEILNKVILPRFFLRRTKFLIKEQTDDPSQLPQKIDQAVFCPLAPIQREVYKRILALPEVQDLIMKEDPCPCGSRIARKKCCHPFQPENLFVYMHHLISCANHVALLLPGPNDTSEQIERYADLNKRVLKDIYADEGRRYKLTYSLAILQRDMCGKLDILRALLKQWHKEGSNKVLIFTKSLKLMEVLEFHMKRDSYDFRKLDGSVPQKHRQKYIDEFNEQPEVYCFLISTLAGGTGINLTAANKVVIFDPNWNPAHDLQAMDRAFRYGQTRDVYVYRLLGGGSLEELVYARQLYKQQQMAIGYDASAQTRYFTGVQGDPQKQGELFGIKNMFTYHEDEQTTKMAIERATIADLDFNLAKGSASGSTAKKGKDGKKLLGKEEAADLRGLGAFMFDDLSPKKKQKQPQTAEQRILSESGVTYTHRNDELIKGAPRKSMASASTSKAPAAKKPRASTSKAKATNTLQSDPNWPPRRGKVFREAKAAALAAGIPYVPPPRGQLPTLPVVPPKEATSPKARTPSKSPTPPKARTPSKPPAKDSRTYKQRLLDKYEVLVALEIVSDRASLLEYAKEFESETEEQKQKILARLDEFQEERFSQSQAAGKS